MHVLISNHAAEVAAFRQALGAHVSGLEVVENNLGALSLIGHRLDQIETLVITEHQDEGVNVETPTFVRNIASHALGGVRIVVVGPVPDGADGLAESVDSIAAAAAIVRESHKLELVGAAPATTHTNGHATPDWSATETEVAAEPEPAEIATQPAAEAVAPAEPSRSLADDIRDWNERNEQQRGQQRVATQPSLAERIAAMMPAARRLRAEENELDAAIRAPRLPRCHSMAVISPKGGVGKSFLTYVIGNVLSEVRGDKVVAVDTNPDFGTLADQVRGRDSNTVSTLLDRLDSIKHYSDLRTFTSKVESRLEVLAAPADPDVMATIGADDYSRVFQQLNHYYDTVMFDCGTGFRDDITRFALKQCDQIVLVSAPLFITTGIVIRALGYLNQIGCDLSRVTLAINQVRNEKPLDLDYMRSRFGSRLNAIVEIPFDLQLNHAMDRGEFLVERMQPATRVAVKRLTRELVRHFE